MLIKWFLVKKRVSQLVVIFLSSTWISSFILLPPKRHFNLSTFVKNALKYSFVYVAVGLVIELTESNSFSVLIDLVKYHSTADQAVRKPRIHTQLFPDVLYAEGELFLVIQFYAMRGFESVFSLLLSRFPGCLPNLDFPDMFLTKYLFT